MSKKFYVSIDERWAGDYLSREVLSIKKGNGREMGHNFQEIFCEVKKDDVLIFNDKEANKYQVVKKDIEYSIEKYRSKRHGEKIELKRLPTIQEGIRIGDYWPGFDIPTRLIMTEIKRIPIEKKKSFYILYVFYVIKMKAVK